MNVAPSPASRASMRNPSASPYAGGSDGMVSLKVANEKLWSVAYEYEQLIALLKEQHCLALAASEREVADLKKCGGGTSPTDAAPAGSVCMDSQIATYSSMLQVRDKQISDLMSKLGCEGGVCDVEDFTGKLAAAKEENKELRDVIIKQEKQIQAWQDVDPRMTDNAAMQLGAQAINMVQHTMKYKERMEAAEQKNEELIEKLFDANKTIDEYDTQLMQFRQDNADLTAVIASKEHQLLEADQQLKEAQNSIKAVQSAMSDEQESRAATERELNTQIACEKRLNQELRQEIQVQHNRIFSHKEEIANLSLHLEDSETAFAQQSRSLKAAEDSLETVVNKATQQNALCQEMTQQISHSESKLHKYQMDHLLKTRCEEQEQESRDLNVNRAFKQHVSLIEKLAKDLDKTKKCINEIRKHSNYADDGTSLDELDAEVSHTIAMVAGTTTDDLFVSKKFTSPIKPASPSGEDNAASSSSRAPANKTLNPSVGQNATIAPRGANLSDYVAYPDDGVDVAIGEFVKSQTDKPHLKAMFCRLSPGKYLYGTQKADIELDHNKQLQARHPVTGNFVPMDSFVNEMAQKQ